MTSTATVLKILPNKVKEDADIVLVFTLDSLIARLAISPQSQFLIFLNDSLQREIKRQYHLQDKNRSYVTTNRAHMYKLSNIDHVLYHADTCWPCLYENQFKPFSVAVLSDVFLS